MFINLRRIRRWPKESPRPSVCSFGFLLLALFLIVRVKSWGTVCGGGRGRVEGRGKRLVPNEIGTPAKSLKTVTRDVVPGTGENREKTKKGGTHTEATHRFTDPGHSRESRPRLTSQTAGHVSRDASGKPQRKLCLFVFSHFFLRRNWRLERQIVVSDRIFFSFFTNERLSFSDTFWIPVWYGPLPLGVLAKRTYRNGNVATI